LSKKLTVSQMRSLRNIVGNPALPAVLGRLQPQTLVRLIERVGLNDAAELMALVPAPRLLRALDEAVWKSPRLGVNPVFDSVEFINWLQVWNEVGEPFVAERLAAFNDEYLAMCLSSVLLVDGGSSTSLDGDASEIAEDSHAQEAGYAGSAKSDCYAIYGHHLTRPLLEDDWEIIRAALDALWRHTPDRLLSILETLSSSESMLDSDGRRTSLNLDVAFARERHLERRGYVSPAGARAFLASTLIATTHELLMMTVYDHETRRFLAGMENHDAGQHPIERVAATDGADDESQTQNDVRGLESVPASQDQIRSLGRLLESEAIVEPQQFESLPWDQHEPRRPVLTEMLNRLEDEAPAAFQQRTRELAYLATVLMAGSSLEGQRFSGRDARDAALATCNLGVGVILSRQSALNLDAEPGLIRPFLIGWHLLHTVRDSVIDAMQTLSIDLESSQRLKNFPWLRNETRIGIRDLRKAVEQQRFADVRDAATFLSIVFDATACRAIAPMLDHLPHFTMTMQNKSKELQPRWIESISDLDQVDSLLSGLMKA
jgi:Family of unknown function (DUF6178)